MTGPRMPPAWWPGATRRPVRWAESTRPFTTRPLGWILHVVVGNGSPFKTFDKSISPRRRFSHLWVAKNGTAEQYAPLNVVSWAQGDGNGNYWSVETEGYPTEPLTDAQLDTLAAWHAWSGTADSLADSPGCAGIGTHAMGGAAWGGHTCPDPSPGLPGPRSHQRAEILRRATGDTVVHDPLDTNDIAAVATAVETRYTITSPAGGEITLRPAVEDVLARLARIEARLAAPVNVTVDVDRLGAAVAAHLPATLADQIIDVAALRLKRP